MASGSGDQIQNTSVFLQFMKMSVPQLTMVWFIHNLGSAIQLVEMEHMVHTSNINIWKVACI